MTKEEIKELLAKRQKICKEAERTILDMKVTLQKYKGDKTKQEKHLQNLGNLLNLAVKQGVDLQNYEDLLAQYLMKIGEQGARIREMEERYKISEQLHEIGVDAVVDNYIEKVTK